MQSLYSDEKSTETQAFIPAEAEDDSVGNTVPRTNRLATSNTTFGLSLLAALLLGFLTSSTWTLIDSLPSPKLHCGNSTAEAKALGCKFDLLAAGWVPKPCIDKTSDDEYKAWILNPARRLGPFPYFKDTNFTQSLNNIDELSQWTDTIYTTKEEHLGHCSQLMRRVHRVAVEGGRKASINTDKDETGVISSMHVKHCVKILWEQASEDEKGGKPPLKFTKFSVNYLTC